MRKLKTAHKILLSLPTAFIIFSLTSFIFPQSFLWLFPDMKTHAIWTNTLNLSAIACSLILIIRLWKFNALTKHTKTRWTILLIIFPAPAAPIYAWHMDKELIKQNNNAYFQPEMKI